MTKHAPEPLCPKCKEDSYDLVTANRDGRIVVWCCSMCGHSWRPDVRDVSGHQMTDP